MWLSKTRSIWKLQFDKYTQGDLLQQLLVLAVPWLPLRPSFLQPDLYASRENVTVEVWGWPLATHLLPLGHCVSPHSFQGFGNTTHHPLTGCTGIAHSVSKAGLFRVPTPCRDGHFLAFLENSFFSLCGSGSLLRIQSVGVWNLPPIFS